MAYCQVDVGAVQTVLDVYQAYRCVAIDSRLEATLGDLGMVEEREVCLGTEGSSWSTACRAADSPDGMPDSATVVYLGDYQVQHPF